MTKRRGDKTPEPPGGRAAERLRMFVEARQPKTGLAAKQKKRRQGPKKPGTTNQGES